MFLCKKIKQENIATKKYFDYLNDIIEKNTNHISELEQNKNNLLHDIYFNDDVKNIDNEINKITESILISSNERDK